MAARYWICGSLLFTPDGTQVRRDLGQGQPSIHHVSHFQHRWYYAALEPACRFKNMKNINKNAQSVKIINNY